jgi:hypothetical protein
MSRPQRIALGLWLVVPIVIWHTIYDLMLTRGVQEYLFRVALHQAGRGPLVSMADVMDRNIYDAVWVSTLFASLVALAGFMSIRMLTSAGPDRAPGAAGS